VTDQNPWTGQIQVLDGSGATRLTEHVWRCYDTVFGDVADFATFRDELFERHAGRDGFRLAVAVDGGAVVGFSWGYIGKRGQYWPDLLAQALEPEIVDAWVGGHFEFVELAVLPAYRRSGLGQALHDRLLDGIRVRCLLSTTDDASDPAVRLYRRSGWRRLGILRPGVQVMGRQSW